MLEDLALSVDTQPTSEKLAVIACESKNWVAIEQIRATSVPKQLSGLWNEWHRTYQAKFTQSKKLVDVCLDKGSVFMQANLARDKAYHIEATVPIAFVLVNFATKSARVATSSLLKVSGLPEALLKTTLAQLTSAETPILKQA